MGIKIYDFDHTIYDGNSTLDFYFYCLKKHPSVVVRIPWQVSAALLYLMRIYNKTQFKQSFFSFLTLLHQIDELIFGFWTIYRKNLKQWYLCKEHSEDVVISASPEFLLKPVCDMLQVKMLIASKVDQKTGIFQSANCYGIEKVRRLNQHFHNDNIEEFYSDSLSDAPLVRLAKKSYRVKKDTLIKW